MLKKPKQLSFLAPEIFFDNDVSYLSDYYSIGILIYFVILNQVPNNSITYKDYIRYLEAE